MTIRGTTLFFILPVLLLCALPLSGQDATSSASEKSSPAPAQQAPQAAPAAPSRVPAVTWIHRVADREANTVGFSHAVHANAGVSCQTCHHAGLSGWQAQACAACHTGTQAVTVMHQACIGCHQSRGEGPVACVQCHTGPQRTAAGIFRFGLYDLARGPFLVIACILFAVGFAWRALQLRGLTHAARTAPFPVAPAPDPDLAFMDKGTRTVFGRMLLRLRRWERRTVFSTNPVMARASTLFHVLLFAVPLLVPAHAILGRVLPERAVDVLTIVLLAFGAFFLLRRILVPRVRALSTLRDYGVLALVAAPFVTAFMAYHQWLDYRSVLVTHILTGDLLIAAIPFTKLGHMPFLVFARFFAGGERAWKPANRRW